ncbi:hypothetical protein AUJ84_01605 [Candidatus Pacearchaeota archaeon CG1_02_32_132]|nr:MAG: hypothetical protein AUJ84_01605 [Candidatus Pacearchaeota archaeon CG1_02_32_132]
MKLILDNNILFSLMNPNSTASELFSLEEIELIAPSFIKEEFNKYQEECLKKSSLSKKEFDERWEEISSAIDFIEESDYIEHIETSKDLISDKDDTPYLALAIENNIPIWSNDSHLKTQNRIKVYTTKELLDELESNS